jgi:plastocyanin
MRRLAVAGLLGIALLAAMSTSAWAAPAAITGDGADTFVGGPNFAHDPGTVAQLTVTGSQHNVVSNAKGPDGKALFRSPTISGGSTPIGGTQFLAAGSYPFICTIHPSTMSGNLVVGAGTPQPRPTVAVEALDRKLAKVVKSSRLRVRVTTTGTGIVAVGAAVGNKRVAGPSQVTGAVSTVVKLPISSRGRARLERLRKAKVKVTGSVDFGAPSSAVAKLK